MFLGFFPLQPPIWTAHGSSRPASSTWSGDGSEPDEGLWTYMHIHTQYDFLHSNDNETVSLCLSFQPVPTIGRSSLSLIQLTNSSPGHGTYQRPQYHNSLGGSMQHNMGGNRGPRPLDQVTCYKVRDTSLCLPPLVKINPAMNCTPELHAQCFVI